MIKLSITSQSELRNKGTGREDKILQLRYREVLNNLKVLQKKFDLYQLQIVKTSRQLLP